MTKFLAALPLAALAFLAACGSETDKSSTKPSASATAPSPAAAPSPAPAPAAPASYDATLAEGIQFSRGGYPAFVRDVKGVSGREDFGRWTEGPEAIIAFSQPLPTAFTLTVETVRAYGPNAGKRLRIKAGTWSGEADLTSAPQVLQFPVKSSAAPDSIQLLIPAPQSPKQAGENADSRMLGVALKRLSIAAP
jgi:phosphoglycerol transferase